MKLSTRLGEAERDLRLPGFPSDDAQRQIGFIRNHLRPYARDLAAQETINTKDSGREAEITVAALAIAARHGALPGVGETAGHVIWAEAKAYAAKVRDRVRMGCLPLIREGRPEVEIILAAREACRDVHVLDEDLVLYLAAMIRAHASKQGARRGLSA